MAALTASVKLLDDGWVIDGQSDQVWRLRASIILHLRQAHLACGIGSPT